MVSRFLREDNEVNQAKVEYKIRFNKCVAWRVLKWLKLIFGLRKAW